MFAPEEMEERYRRFLKGRGDVIRSLLLYLREEGGARTESGAWAALVLSRICLVRGNLDSSLSYLRTSKDIFESLNKGLCPPGVFVNKALIHRYRGERRRAESLLKDIFSRSLREGHSLSAAKAASNLSVLLARRGILDEAISYLDFSRRIHDNLGNARAETTHILIGSLVDMEKGKFGRVLEDMDGISFPGFALESPRDLMTVSLLKAEALIRAGETYMAGNELKAVSRISGVDIFEPKNMARLYLQSIVENRIGNREKSLERLAAAEEIRKRLGLAVEKTLSRLLREEADLSRSRVFSTGFVQRGPSIMAKELQCPGGKELSEGRNDFYTRSETVIKLMECLKEAAETDLPILIRGETGTGKELLAGYIHKWSKRADGPFVPMNIAAIPEQLVVSGLFGHAPGAFTGASTRSRGLVGSAVNGTVFFDEIGEMRPGPQVKLLRFLDSGEYYPLGESSSRKGDTRIVAATNRDLEKAVDEGSFRKDLYYRLRVLEFSIPPLRERKEDILPLALRFMGEFRRDYGRGPVEISRRAAGLLESYTWPGNVRELKNEIIRGCFKSGSRVLRAGDLSVNPILREAFIEKQPARTLDEKMERIEREEILRALDSAGGNLTNAARALGLKRTTLIYRAKRLGLK